MTTDYTAAAQTLIAATTATPWNHGRDDLGPGFDFFFADLNAEVGVPAATEADARAALLPEVVAMLKRRDGYVDPPAPSAADQVLAALQAIDPATASVSDVVDSVKQALTVAGADPQAVASA